MLKYLHIFPKWGQNGLEPLWGWVSEHSWTWACTAELNVEKCILCFFFFFHSKCSLYRTSVFLEFSFFFFSFFLFLADCLSYVVGIRGGRKRGNERDENNEEEVCEVYLYQVSQGITWGPLKAQTPTPPPTPSPGHRTEATFRDGQSVEKCRYGYCVLSVWHPGALALGEVIVGGNDYGGGAGAKSGGRGVVTADWIRSPDWQRCRHVYQTLRGQEVHSRGGGREGGR